MAAILPTNGLIPFNEAMVADDAMPPLDPGLAVPQDGEQQLDTALRPPPGVEPELDAFGVPVRDQSAASRMPLLTAGSLICAIVSASLAIAEGINHDLHGSLPVLGVVLGFLPSVPISFGGRFTDKIRKLGLMSRTIVVAAAILGAVSAVAIMAWVDPNAMS